MMKAKLKYGTGDDRREEIATAAREIILEKGIEGLRTREVAARVGINIATLHYHASGKDGIVLLVAQALKRDFERYFGSLTEHAETQHEILRRLMAGYRDTMREKPDVLQIMDALVQLGKTNEEVQDIVNAMRAHWYNLFVAVLEAGKKNGEFRASLEPDASAHMIVGALFAFRYKPKRFFPLFDSVAEEIIRSITAHPEL